jgi:hypothetical protein
MLPGRARVLAAVALGVGFGAATSLSNAAVSPSSPDSLARVPSLILDSGWAWAGVAVLAGWLAGRPARAAVAGAVALLGGAAAYYGIDSVVRDEPLAGYGPELVRWWLAGLFLGPLLGGVGALARGRGLVGLLCRLAVPAGALGQMIVHPPGSGAPTGARAATWALTIVAAAAAVSAGAVLSWFLLERRRVHGVGADA